MIYGANHEEGAFRKAIMLAVQYLLEASYRLLDRHVLSRYSSEGLCHVAQAVGTVREPMQILSLPFATGDAAEVSLVINNAGATSQTRIGTVAMFEQGPTAYRWTRYPRLLVHLLQIPFITACMLPLTLAGIALLAKAREWLALSLLLIVPAYFLCLQSALHTERRYIIAIHYFLFALAAVPIAVLIKKLQQTIARVSG